MQKPNLIQNLIRNSLAFVWHGKDKPLPEVTLTDAEIKLSAVIEGIQFTASGYSEADAAKNIANKYLHWLADRERSRP